MGRVKVSGGGQTRKWAGPGDMIRGGRESGFPGRGGSGQAVGMSERHWEGWGGEQGLAGKPGAVGPSRGRLGLQPGVKPGEGAVVEGERGQGLRRQSWGTAHISAKQGRAGARGWRWSQVKATE